MRSEEKQSIRELAGKDEVKGARLMAAACAMAKCFTEYPEDSAAYQYFKQIADLGDWPMNASYCRVCDSHTSFQLE
ncbi:unnamed protein product [Mycetohabitans rhizoxinica HKI 454]|uniref:Uncharacterized protein n=1 Tax=Mycetohabitans rhizoxinica (strain DSM 19002 / CIP 109453 / HKI 454) TaxID=882378 RepID=E5ARN1_MYCRK|nr:unnamed protein product [Mycetohabitans rhizoxinica HKI 454]